MFWADAVLENFAPRAMRGFGLDYESMAKEKPDLVMVSTCLNGQTGPHRNYLGFGGQGSALSGFNAVTGWPDREPTGPYGTITDSLAPRFAATALAAGILLRRRTGHGVHLDIAQVEAAQYTPAPWILDYANNGRIGPRSGNRSERTAPPTDGLRRSSGSTPTRCCATCSASRRTRSGASGTPGASSERRPRRAPSGELTCTGAAGVACALHPPAGRREETAP